MGDYLLSHTQATGYNIILSSEDMPLAILIKFGKKASKVRYGGWPLAAADEKVDRVRTVTQEIAIDNQGQEMQVSKTVELVVIISPSDNNNALRIVEFLQKRTSAIESDAIAGSWDVPDVRATAALSAALKQAGFKVVEANFLELRGSQLVVAKQQTVFPLPWDQVPGSSMNQELAKYLVGFGVTP